MPYDSRLILTHPQAALVQAPPEMVQTVIIRPWLRIQRVHRFLHVVALDLEQEREIFLFRLPDCVHWICPDSGSIQCISINLYSSWDTASGLGWTEAIGQDGFVS